MNKKGFEEWGEQRRVRSIKKRSQKAEALKEEVLKLREECPEITQKDIALMLGVSTRTVIRKLGQGKIEKVASI